MRVSIPDGAKAAVVYSIANIFSRGLAVVTMPIFTRLLTTDQIGLVNLYSSWFSLISCFATLSLTAGGFAVAMKEYEGHRRQYMSSVLTLTTLLSIIIAIVYLLNIDFWNSVTGLPTSLMFLLIVGLVVSPSMDFWLAFERYEYRYIAPAIVVSLSALMASLASVVAVMSFASKGDALGEVRLVSNYLVIYLFNSFTYVYIIIKGRNYVNLSYWKFSLGLSLPLVGYSIASQILGVSDRLMIGNMVGNSAVGIYGTVYSVGTLFTMVWTAINSSFVPYLYQNITRKDEEIKSISANILQFYSLAAILAVFLAPEIIGILATEDYYEAIYVMPPIAAGVFYTSIANMYSNILLYEKKSKHIMTSAAVAAFINIALNYIFIPQFGYMAAAYTTMLSYAVMLLLLYLSSNQTFFRSEGYPLSTVYNNKKIIKLTILTTAIMMIGLPLYGYPILRYCFIIISISICILSGLRIHIKGN